MTESLIPSSLAHLTPRNRRIVAEFVADRDIWKAAKAAGMKPEKLTNGFLQGLKKRLAPAIAAYEAEILEAVGISAQRIMEELELQAFYDPKDLFDQDSDGYLTIRAFDELGPLSRVIEGVERVINTKDHTETLKVKLASKKSALDTLARIKGMTKDAAPAGVAMQVNLNFAGANER